MNDIEELINKLRVSVSTRVLDIDLFCTAVENGLSVATNGEIWDLKGEISGVCAYAEITNSELFNDDELEKLSELAWKIRDVSHERWKIKKEAEEKAIESGCVTAIDSKPPIEERTVLGDDSGTSESGGWNNRVIRRGASGDYRYGIHEAHYSTKGEIVGWTQDPVEVAGDNIIWEMKKMLMALKKDVLIEEVVDGKEVLVRIENSALIKSDSCSC